MAKKNLLPAQLTPGTNGTEPHGRIFGFPRTGEIIEVGQHAVSTHVTPSKGPSSVPDTDALLTAFKRRCSAPPCWDCSPWRRAARGCSI